MGINELLRRMALTIGVGAFLWLWMDSPAAILEVSRADFAGRYQREYGDGHPARRAESLLGEAPRLSVAEFTAKETQHRLLPEGVPAWSEYYRSLPVGSLYCSLDQAPFAAVRRQIESQFAKSQRPTMYLPVRDGVRTGFIEISYVYEPRKSKAPPEVVFPERHRAWPWLAAALLLYGLIPWRSSAACAAYSRIAILSLDGLGLLFASTFLALRLWIANSTAEVFGSELGVTVFLGILGMVGVLLMLWTGQMAAFRVRGSSSALRLENLWRGKEISLAEVDGTGHLVRNGIETGIFIHCRDGGTVKLDWVGVVRFEPILQVIAATGVAKMQDLAA